MADSTFLERIVASTRQHLAERMAKIPLEALMQRAAEAPAPRSFAAALQPAVGGPARLIAEIKRASPSKGVLVETFNPVVQACAYERGGAAAISVLTEPDFFQGSLEHLSAVRNAVNIPVLRKDFILDDYQVYEALAAGADAILLICAMLDDDQLARLHVLALRLGMQTLVEAHNAAEIERAVRCGAGIIGVNSRDLRTFAVDVEVVRHLRHYVPADSIFVAESGIADQLSATRARAWGADAILVGEALMRAPDPAAKAHELATASGGASAQLLGRHSMPFIKLCGLAQPEHGILAAELKADAIGFIFAPSRRRITPEQARAVIEAAKKKRTTSERGPFPAIEKTGITRQPPPLTPPPPDGERGEPASIRHDDALRPLPFREGGWGLGYIGVFVNESPDTIAEIATAVGLNAIQLSGDESSAACAELAARTQLPIIKALRLRNEADLALLDDYALAGVVLLLDTPATDGSYGGSGQTGNWDLAGQAAERWPIILSGGLSPANVAEALKLVQPAGVDVSSGIETDGAKDSVKMRAFVQAARNATPN